jgi:hypothetical protein
MNTRKTRTAPAGTRTRAAACAGISAAALLLALAPIGAGCGNTSAPNPYGYDAGSDAAEGGPDGSGGGGEGGGPADAGPDVDPTLGGPCLDDGQCDDGFDCTFDACDLTLQRCRFTPDDAKCQNGVYCDGVEQCDNKLGCIAGPPVSCDDKTPCTIDTCDEASQTCKHVPRDADGDGDPDWHCPGGHDCDDNNPNVNSLTPEVCGNGKDDNCNGQVDEMPCGSPQHDTCLDPLQISASGTYAMDTTGAKFDYPTTCGLGNNPNAKDVVAAILLPAGPPVDVEVKAGTIGYPVAVAMAGQCGDPSTELCCGSSFSAATGGTFAKARARGLGSAAQMTAFPVYVATAPGVQVALDVQIVPAVPKATNETCGTAAPITPGVPVTTEIIDAAQDLASMCGTQLGELVYTFDLATTSDVDVYASSVDGDGNPVIGLRGPGCAMASDELSCQSAAAPHVYRKALPPGTYYVSVSATAPTTVQVTVDLSAPTTPAADETCTGAPVLAPNKTIPVTLMGHQDDVFLGCLPGAVDAAYELDLAKASDVLLVERIANADVGSVGLAAPACTAAAALGCQTGSTSPVRESRRNVPAGSYRVVAESQLGENVELTAFVRDAVPPTLVPFSDGCADAITIPPTGGFFQGNTANATADFMAGCDQGGVTGGGAKDQLLKLNLAATKRVILDMSGSGYNTLLDVRQGPNCPGTEVPMACAVGYYQGRSYLDLVLSAGTYYVQVDGYLLDEGPWFLDVRVVDP